MGLEVKLTISKTDDGDLSMNVDSSGKFKRKATWEDLSAFSGLEVDSDLVKDWIYNYQKQNFPDALEKPNFRPFKCFICDEPKKGFTLFKDYGWNPVKLELKVGMTDVKAKTTTKICLIESFEWEEMASKLAQNENLHVTSTIKKTKLAGHPLALQMMKSSSTIESDFQGFESEWLFITPTNPKSADEVEEETGTEIWKVSRALVDLLDGQDKPTKKEAGWKYEVVAYEHTVKARIYYKAMFTGEVSTDHKEQYDGRRYWNFPLKYLLQYNDIQKQQLIYEDVEFIFYTGVSITDIEPGAMTLRIEDEEGNKYEIQAKPADTASDIRSKIEQATAIAVTRQVVKYEDSDLPEDKNCEELEIRNGSTLNLSIFKIPISVNCPDDQVLNLYLEPIDTISKLKGMIQEGTNIKEEKQIIKLADDILTKGTMDDNGIKAGSVLSLVEDFDPIIFVDIKCNTLFAVDRKVVIEKKGLTSIDDSNDSEFKETITNKEARAKILENMNEAPHLGVNPNKVVEKRVVESLGHQEAESVQNLWGVSLKTREQNKKGEELYFIDPKTGAVGELLRNQYIKSNFITPVTEAENKETLAEAEQDSQKYDKYIGYIRRAFGIEIIPRGV